jgi:Zn finger protein HypA/HybF involved in hydrogenase expression
MTAENKFYCKYCKKEFEVITDDKLWNARCPNCSAFSLPVNYTLPGLAGMPTERFHK